MDLPKYKCIGPDNVVDTLSHSLAWHKARMSSRGKAGVTAILHGLDPPPSQNFHLALYQCSSYDIFLEYLVGVRPVSLLFSRVWTYPPPKISPCIIPMFFLWHIPRISSRGKAGFSAILQGLDLPPSTNFTLHCWYSLTFSGMTQG